MPLYSVETILGPEEAVEETMAYFGERGLGLEVTEEGSCCARFQGGGGFVGVTADKEEDEEKTTVELETREWDYHVKRFMREIGS